MQKSIEKNTLERLKKKTELEIKVRQDRIDTDIKSIEDLRLEWEILNQLL